MLRIRVAGADMVLHPSGAATMAALTQWRAEHAGLELTLPMALPVV